MREQVEGADAPTLAVLFNHLGREMGMMRNDRLGKAEFRKLRQRPEETLRELTRQVRNIGKIAYSAQDPQHERRVVPGEVSRNLVVERKLTNILGI